MKKMRLLITISGKRIMIRIGLCKIVICFEPQIFLESVEMLLESILALMKHAKIFQEIMSESPKTLQIYISVSENLGGMQIKLSDEHLDMPDLQFASVEKATRTL
jgi:hypothetical protein